MAITLNASTPPPFFQEHDLLDAMDLKIKIEEQCGE